MKTQVTLPGEKLEEKEKEKQISPEEKQEIVEKPLPLVHLDFSAKNKSASPFRKANVLPKRLKLLLWGDTGVGKTVTALQFPSPVVLDLEGGTDLYGECFQFDISRPKTADEIMEAIDWLLANKHPYRTLVIDPITVYWEALQKKWSDVFIKRNKGSKGYKHEFYDLQVRDWMTVKSEWKEFIRKLVMLDMTVIVTAREKTKYKEGSMMVAIGETFDSEKSLPYIFDVIVRMYKDDSGKYMGHCIKDRSNKLPDEFECSYSFFETMFGSHYLGKEAMPQKIITVEQKELIISFIQTLKLSPDLVEKRLATYNAESLDDLTYDNAEIIIARLRTTINSITKENTNAQN